MDSLDIRLLKDTDYQEILVGWWKDWGWEAPPDKDSLPEDGKGGIMIMDGDTPVCAGFMYVTNSKIAWIDWIISNKNYRKKPQRKEAIKLLIETLTNVCKNSGSKYAYSLFKGNNLIDAFKISGYKKVDSYKFEMIKIL
jgi:hypothetical protein